MLKLSELKICIYKKDDLCIAKKTNCVFSKNGNCNVGKLDQALKPKSDNIGEQLDRLTDELIENLIKTPDEEILREVEEDYGDPLYEANKVREILEKAKKNVDERKKNRNKKILDDKNA